MSYLFLDDVRQPKDVKWIDIPAANWIIVRNYAQFCDHVQKNGVPHFISFDHDLEDFHYGHNSDKKSLELLERTGLSCVKFLCHYCQVNNLKFPEYLIHSLNKDGGENMESYIKSFKKVYGI